MGARQFSVVATLPLRLAFLFIRMSCCEAHGPEGHESVSCWLTDDDQSFSGSLLQGMSYQRKSITLKLNKDGELHLVRQPRLTGNSTEWQLATEPQITDASISVGVSAPLAHSKPNSKLGLSATKLGNQSGSQSISPVKLTPLLQKAKDWVKEHQLKREKDQLKRKKDQRKHEIEKELDQQKRLLEIDLYGAPLQDTNKTRAHTMNSTSMSLKQKTNVSTKGNASGSFVPAGSSHSHMGLDWWYQLLGYLSGAPLQDTNETRAHTMNSTSKSLKQITNVSTKGNASGSFTPFGPSHSHGFDWFYQLLGWEEGLLIHFVTGAVFTFLGVFFIWVNAWILACCVFGGQEAKVYLARRS